jgi:hypothetical protein
MTFAFEHPGRWDAGYAVFCECLVQPLDDIAALPKCAQAWFRVSGQNPARGTGRLRKREPFERPHPADLNFPQRIASGIASWPKIDYPFRPSRFPAQRPIKLGPAFGSNLRFKAAPDLKLRSRAELPGNKISGTRPQARSDVIAADDKVRATVGAAAHQDVDMGMLGIPVIDRDPVEPRTKIARGLMHEFAGKAPQAFQLARIIRRDNEPEMMPVAFAALSESPAVCIVPGNIEEFAGRSIAGDAVPLEITDMGSQRPGRSHPTHDTRLDHGAAGAIAK